MSSDVSAKSHLKSSILLSLLSVGVFAAIVWGIHFSQAGEIAFADTAGFSIRQSGWFALTNFSSNAYLPWRFDRLLAALANGSLLTLVLLHLWILSCGIVAFAVSLDFSATRALFASVLMLSALYFVGAVDFVVLSTLTWIPWLLLLPALLSRYGLRGVIIAIFIAWQFIECANQLSLVCCLVIALLMRISGPKVAWQHYPLFFVGFFSLIRQFRTPVLPAPQYPAAASVVTHWGSDGGVQPLIGAGITTPYIDRLLIGGLYWPLASVLLSLSVVLFVLLWRRQSALFNGLLSVAAILSACVLLDCPDLIPIELVQIMPLAAVARLLPNLIFICLTPIAFGLAMLLLTLAAVISTSRLPLILNSVCLALLLSFSGSLPFALDPRARDVFSAFDRLPPEEQAAAFKILNSPSLAVIKRFGVQWITKLNYIQQTKFRPVSMRAEISATHEPGLIKQMRDRKPKTRWTTSLGHQSGKEWVMLRLPQARSVSAIGLPAEPFSTDFPRGLEIAATPQCSGLVSEIEHFTTIVREPRWSGWINVSVDGYPYIEPSSRVNVIFPEALQAQCIVIKQIGQDKNFDWSISELRIADHGENPTAEDAEDSLD